MLYENTLLLYGAGDYLVKTEEDRKKVIGMAERLKGIDADLDELLDAILYMQGVRDELLKSYDANLMIEYGMINNDALIAQEKKRIRMMNIVKSNKSIDNLLAAVEYVKKEEATQRLAA